MTLHLMASSKIVWTLGKLEGLVIFYGVKYRHSLCVTIQIEQGNGDLWLVLNIVNKKIEWVIYTRMIKKWNLIRSLLKVSSKTHTYTHTNTHPYIYIYIYIYIYLYVEEMTNKMYFGKMYFGIKVFEMDEKYNESSVIYLFFL